MEKERGGGVENFSLADLGEDDDRLDVFLVLDEELAKTRSLRERAYFALALAEHHHRAGHSMIANSLAENLFTRIEGATVFDWEPCLRSRLEKLSLG